MTDISVYLIGPDGHKIQLDRPGNAVQIQPEFLAELKMCGVETVLQRYYKAAGGDFAGRSIPPREIAVPLVISGDDAYDLVENRATVWDVVNWLRGDNSDYVSFVLQKTGGDEVELRCQYGGAEVTQDVNAPETLSRAVVRLLAPDPAWYSRQESDEALTLFKEMDLYNFVVLAGGRWNRLGISTDYGKVRAIAVQSGTGDIYIGGAFTNWDGVAAADRIARYNRRTHTWEALGSGIADGEVRALLFGSDGRLYIAGTFTKAGGSPGDGVVAWDGAEYEELGSPGTGATLNGINALAEDGLGNIWVGGNFTNLAGNPANDYVALWSGSAWIPASGNGLDGTVKGLVYEAASDYMYACGDFTQDGGGNARVRIISYAGDNSSNEALGDGLTGGASPTAIAMAVDKWNNVWVGGEFTDADGVTVSNVAYYDGEKFHSPGDGVNDRVRALALDETSGDMWAGGDFTEADGESAIFLAVFDGDGWRPVDIFSSAKKPTMLYRVVIDTDGYVYIGADLSATDVPAGKEHEIEVDGSAKGWPIIEIANACYSPIIIENWSTRERVVIRRALLDGEVLTIDCRPGKKTVESSRQGLLLPAPGSDIGTFHLAPLPRVTEPSGYDLFDDLDGITGRNGINTDNNRLALSSSGGPIVDVSIYKRPYGDADMALYEVADGSIVGTGSVALAAVNGSGIGGTVTLRDDGAKGGYTEVEFGNVVRVFVRHDGPREIGDDGNLLSGWDGLTGVTFDNSDNGKLYVKVTDEGGGDYRVWLYKHPSMSSNAKVGWTAAYSGTGSQAIISNDGLGGSITVDALGTDNMITVFFTIGRVRWYNRWWSGDEAITQV